MEERSSLSSGDKFSKAASYLPVMHLICKLWAIPVNEDTPSMKEILTSQ